MSNQHFANAAEQQAEALRESDAYRGLQGQPLSEEELRENRRMRNLYITQRKTEPLTVIENACVRDLEDRRRWLQASLDTIDTTVEGWKAELIDIDQALAAIKGRKA